MSRKANPTPGPWFAEDVDGGGALSICTDVRPRHPGAGFPTMLGFFLATEPAHAHDGDPSYSESLANARLAAAAPDLLEACERATAMLAEYPSVVLGMKEWHVEQIRLVLTPAIAAARGEVA